MEVTQAWQVLGLSPCDDPSAIRAAYARRVRQLHPDRSDAPDAHDATLLLNAAYRAVLEAVTAPASPSPPPPSAPRPDPAAGASSADRRTADPPTAQATSVIPVAMLADDTIGIGVPGHEAYYLTVEALHRLGEVTHDERGSGLLQVLVEFVDGPICQLLVTLQGRATGVTELFCTIESIDDRPAPPVEAVTRLLMDTLTGH